jgi:hypothetical protein
MSFIIGGARYDIESSTYIQSVRGDATQFPTKSLSKTFKPIYEWLRDLSQIEYLNTDAELAGTLLYGRPFMFWVDENNYFHWVEQSDTTGGSLTVGVDKIYSSKLNKSTFDAMNMIIFNAGTDMNGHGILDFYLDDDSKIKGNKMQFVPMLSIAKSNIDDDYKINTSRNDGRFPQYVTAGSYPLTNTAWGATGIANDSEYNTTLRAKCKADGQKRARSIVSKTSGARWKGSVQMKGQIYTPGTLLLFTDIRAGLYNQKLRVMEVKHSIEKIWKKIQKQ